MVRSWNWPDLWSQISNIRDKKVVDIYDLMKRWKLETNRINSVATAQPQSQNLIFFTSPGDLTFGDLGLKFLHNVSYTIINRYSKIGGAARRRFSTIRKKPEGWTFFAPLQCACQPLTRLGAYHAPLGFFWITHEPCPISTWNLAWLSEHQFYVVWCKKKIRFGQKKRYSRFCDVTSRDFATKKDNF